MEGGSPIRSFPSESLTILAPREIVATFTSLGCWGTVAVLRSDGATTIPLPCSAAKLTPDPECRERMQNTAAACVRLMTELFINFKSDRTVVNLDLISWAKIWRLGPDCKRSSIDKILSRHLYGRALQMGRKQEWCRALPERKHGRTGARGGAVAKGVELRPISHRLRVYSARNPCVDSLMIIAKAPCTPATEDGSTAKFAPGRKVWLVEDHACVRELMEIFFTTVPGFSLVGASVDAAPILNFSRNDADIILLDLMIPGLGGLEAMRQLREQANPPQIIVFSGTATIHSVHAALSLGAVGYIEKSESLESLRAALARVDHGECYFSTGPSRILAQLARTCGRSLHGQLSAKRELHALSLFVRGETIKSVATDLRISVQTAYNIRQTLLERAHARNPLDLLHYAIEIGLLGSRRATSITALS